jgi:hypothetical protein
MSSLIVVDTSCLIGLDKIGKLVLLPALFDKVLIPPAVFLEFGIEAPFAELVSPKDVDLVKAIGFQLGGGESEAIALALEMKSPIILDDRRARAVGERMGLACIGTVGVLMRAKLKNLTPSLKQCLDDLERRGFYVSQSVKEQALRLVGEK